MLSFVFYNLKVEHIFLDIPFTRTLVPTGFNTYVLVFLSCFVYLMWEFGSRYNLDEFILI